MFQELKSLKWTEVGDLSTLDVGLFCQFSALMNATVAYQSKSNQTPQKKIASFVLFPGIGK